MSRTCSTPRRSTRLLTALVVGSMLVAASLATAAPASAATSTVRAMTLNVFLRGTGAPSANSAASVATTIRAQRADVVALEETGDAFSKSVADQLGWYYTNYRDVAVLSRAPQTNTDRLDAQGAPVAGAEIGGVWYYSTHLSYDPYGPYLFCNDGADAATVTAKMQSQADQAAAVRDWARTPKAQVLMGDFNSPSGLDWTRAASSTHCGTAYDWQTTGVLYRDGWKDTFRQAHPDPVAVPGNSWSAKPANADDPQDRIDFVLTKDGSSTPVTTRSSSMFGDWNDKDWISDHYGFVSELAVG